MSGAKRTRAAVVAAIAIATLALCGCKAVKYVPVETVRTEYKDADTTAIYNHLKSIFESKREKAVRSDSLIDRTKETVVLKENGDTARYDRERIIYRSTNREKELESEVRQQDSVISDLRMQLASIKTDSISIPYPVERELTRWQRTKMDFGGMAMGALVIVLCFAVAWLIKRFKR